jgi:hypothetical protein
MDKKDKVDQFLRQSMQLNADELPEPDAELQKRLRDKVAARKLKSHWIWALLQRLWSMLNVEVKLYQAGLSLGLLVFLFLWLPQQGSVQNTNGSDLLADSIHSKYSSSAKQNKFLIQHFVVKTN